MLTFFIILFSLLLINVLLLIFSVNKHNKPSLKERQLNIAKRATIESNEEIQLNTYKKAV
ncbi:hypothetical protein GTQ40_16660 [Flavobacteriaceae bacterium R38]|nr:hypothetical protein [Flavobacteriaceae bacterium R38]